MRKGDEIEGAAMLAPIVERAVGAGDRVGSAVVGDDEQPAAGLQRRRPLERAAGGIAEGMEEIAVEIAFGRVGGVHDGQRAHALAQSRRRGSASPICRRCPAGRRS